MPAPGSATEVAFLIVALIQAVFAVVWSIGAYTVATHRRAVMHWVAWATLSSVTWLTLSMHVESPPLLGVLAGVLGVMALQRGIRLFIGRKLPHRLHGIMVCIVIAAGWLGWVLPSRPSQAVVNYGVLTWLYLHIAYDLYRHARDQLRFRWPVVLALPVLLGSAAYASRTIRALVAPQSVLTEMAADSALNVHAALIFVVLVLALHSTLTVLVVARLVSELRRLSRHDGLTGLLNRRAMEEVLHAQIERTRRTGETFVLMMLDLDYFKRINDQHGHPVGDLALKHAAALLSMQMSDRATLARFGGEEFVLLMPGRSVAQAHQKIHPNVVSSILSCSQAHRRSLGVHQCA